MIPSRAYVTTDRVRILPLLLALGAAGCGWLRDATGVTVCSGEQGFELDASALTIVNATGDGLIPSVPCATAAECQEALVSCQGPSYSCRADCLQADAIAAGEVQANEQCPVSVTLDYEQVVEIDLSERLASQSQADLLSAGRLTRLVVSVAHNSLNRPTPPLDVYVGPLAATSSNAPGVVRLATIASVAQGEAFEARESPTFGPGRERLAELVGDLDQPFRLFVRGRLQVQTGQPIPSGRLVTTVEPCFRFDLL